MFQSLLFEACGRTVNPVNSDVGLLWIRNWHVCQTAVETVLHDGTMRPMPELLGLDAPTPTAKDASEGEVTYIDKCRVRDSNPNFRFLGLRSDKVSFGGKRMRFEELAKI